MMEVRFTLLSDGSSDQALMHILDWLMRNRFPERGVLGQWADLRRLRRPPEGLADRIVVAVDFYPCDLLFVHRDVERVPLHEGVCEIREAINSICSAIPAHVCVIPVRMTEAWLLVDMNAIKRASGNPACEKDLALPRLRDIEELPDPKQVLHDALRTACGTAGQAPAAVQCGEGCRISWMRLISAG